MCERGLSVGSVSVCVYVCVSVVNVVRVNLSSMSVGRVCECYECVCFSAMSVLSVSLSDVRVCLSGTCV